MNRTFYCAIGANGGVLTTNYAQAKQCHAYLRGHVYDKKFRDLADAQAYLWNHFCEIAPLDLPIPDQFQVGRVYTINSLRSVGKKESWHGL